MSKVIARSVLVNVNEFLEDQETTLKTRIKVNEESGKSEQEIALANEEDYYYTRAKVSAAYEMNIISFTEYQDVMSYFWNTYISTSMEKAEEQTKI